MVSLILFIWLFLIQVCFSAAVCHTSSYWAYFPPASVNFNKRPRVSNFTYTTETACQITRSKVIVPTHTHVTDWFTWIAIKVVGNKAHKQAAAVYYHSALIRQCGVFVDSTLQFCLQPANQLLLVLTLTLKLCNLDASIWQLTWT